MILQSLSSPLCLMECARRQEAAAGVLQAVVLKNVAEKGFDQMIEDAADAVSASPNPLASAPAQRL